MVASGGVNLYIFGVALGPPPPMLSSAPVMMLSAPAIIEGCQSMEWYGSINWVNNPAQSRRVVLDCIRHTHSQRILDWTGLRNA